MAVFGDTLRQARAYKGVTLKEAEQATRINRHHLAALEEENFAVLPPLIYQRGIVRNYAGYLALDPVKLLEAFDEARGADSTPELVAAVKPLEMPNHWAPNFAIIAFLVVMSAIVFAWMYSALFPDGAIEGTQIAAVPTVTPVPTNELPSLFPPTEDASEGEDGSSPPMARVASLPPTEVVAPTATVTATATPIPTVTPSSNDGELVGVTQEPVSEEGRLTTEESAPAQAPLQTLADQGMQVVQEAIVTPQVIEPALVADQGSVQQIRVIADADMEITVVADGTTQYAGWLAAGDSTGYFSGVCFSVTTTRGDAIRFENPALPIGEFPMGYVANTYSLGGCGG